ncbi:MAG: SUF system Fe-S cluster assembly protein [Saprospiraceae bacterium]|nr:SUF system Fe-S cluster assembly protein [Saprospiraceae bacterium]
MNQGADKAAIKERALEAIKEIYDPEIPVDIYELGLIYELEIDEQGVAHVQMTLTSPACPVAESLPAEVHQKLLTVDGITDVNLQLVWSPPWSKERMSDTARLTLNMF